MTFNLPHRRAVSPFPEVFPAFSAPSDLRWCQKLRARPSSPTSSWCSRLYQSIFASAPSIASITQRWRVPTAGKHPSRRSPPHVSVWNSVFCQHLRGKISPSARLIRLLSAYLSKFMCSRSTTFTSFTAVFFGSASQPLFFFISLYFLFVLQTFRVLQNYFNPSEL